jgi:hypothetical protein
MYSKEELKAMDKDIKVKKFLKLIFREFDEDEEYIRIFQNNETRNTEATEIKTKFFNDIDSVVNYVTSGAKYNKNTYFQLSSVDDSESGKTENLKYRYCLGFDFDKKDLGEDFDHLDILNIFKQNKIHFHCLVDSGNGYHVYVCINKTNKLDMVNEVQKVLCEKLKADNHACLPTQILRTPYSYNIKDENKTKLVKIIAMDNRDEIKPYDIEFLYEKNCGKTVVNNASKKQIKYMTNNTNIPKCILSILENGTIEGDRYSDLQKIVVNLRQRNKTIEEITLACKSWADKSSYNDNLDYRIKSIYNNLKYVHMNCKECDSKSECFNFTESEFDFDSLVDEDGVIYETYQLEDKITKKIRNKQNGGINMLNGNEILILNILRLEYDNPRPLTEKFGMDIKLLIRSITHKKKSCLSEKTLRETLNSLIEKKFITEEIGSRNKKYYKFNPIRTALDKTIKISFMATCMCICQNINPNELALYVLIRYLHKQQLVENKTKGNIFVMSQVDLAKAYYKNNTTENQANISKMIKNLIDCHIIDIYDIRTSKNNGYDYYRYRLNC